MPWTSDKQAFFGPLYSPDGQILVTVFWPFLNKVDVVKCDDSFSTLESANLAAITHANLYNYRLSHHQVVAVEIVRPFRPAQGG